MVEIWGTPTLTGWLVVSKMAESEPEGVIFTFGAKSERDQRCAAECLELRQQGLLS